jgi:putative ABC transport system permease protein
MNTFTLLAWRNIQRNRARSLITMSAVGVGLAALIFLKGFIDGADAQMVENYTDLLIGHVQIHKAGFQKNAGLDKIIHNSETITSVLKDLPQIRAWTPRVKDTALISSSENSAGILLLGIEPTAERAISSIHKRLRQGRFLVPSDKDAILIGRGLAENLNVGLNDKVVIMSQAADGSLAASAFTVTGIMEAGADEIDKNLALITLASAQELLVMGDSISEIALKTTNLGDIDAITNFLKKRIDQKYFEVLNWKDISPMTYQWLQFDQVFAGLILLIVLIVVASSILNTVLMGVLERTREFGIMLALGTQPDQIVQMVAVESFMLGTIGTFYGCLFGCGLVLLFGWAGINLSAISNALNSFYIGSIVYTRLDALSVSTYAAAVLFVSFIVALYPAKRAGRLTPIDAIRSN